MSSTEQANLEIEQAILTEWKDWQRPLLISRLGMRLSSPAKEFLSTTGHGLKRYIQENLDDRVRLVPMKGRGGGAVPLSETRDYTDTEIEDLYIKQSNNYSDQEMIPMYWGDVWRGFQNELPEGSVRYILLNSSGQPEVADTPQGTATPINAKMIDRGDLILAAPGEPKPARIVVHQAIENWCRREGVPLNNLKFERPSQPRHSDMAVEKRRGAFDRSYNPNISNRDKVASLMQGIDLLSRDELARISIPADLVLAMLERSGSK